MNALATLMKTGRPVVAVSFDDSFQDEALARAQAAGVEVAELRVDLFKSVAPAHVLEVARRYAAVPRLITVRSAAEGGRWNGTEGQRFELYSKLMPEATAIDIELGSSEIRDLLIELAASKNVLKVVSYHNFTETPDNEFLLGVLRQSKGHGADLVKISVFARTEADVRRLARFTLDHADDGLITISMGPLGTASRVLFPALGSRLTYADIGLATGPGQLPYDTVCDMLRKLYPGFPQGPRSP
jgi:3-dehydroquinate dehydratase I